MRREGKRFRTECHQAFPEFNLLFDFTMNVILIC